MFNRGLTKGYINNAKNDEMVNPLSSNHIGIHLGFYKLSHNKIEIKLNEDLIQGDTIRFKEDEKGGIVNFLYNTHDKLINCAKKGETVFIDNFLDIEKSGEVRKVASITLEKEIDNLPKRKISVSMNVVAKCNIPLKLTVDDGKYSVALESNVVSKAISSPITKDDIIKQMTKTGDTVYRVDSIDIDLDPDVFINLKDLNELRRNALLKLDEERLKRDPLKVYPYSQEMVETTREKGKLLVAVWTKGQYYVAKKYTNNIYSMNERLYNEYSDIKPIYSDSKNINASSCMISDNGSLTKVTSDMDVVANYSLNAVNSYTINNILSYGVNIVILSPEMDLNNILDMKNKVDFSKICLFTYGRVKLMKMKYKPFEIGEKLIDRNGKEYSLKIVGDYKYLVSHEVFDRTKYIDLLKKDGMSNFFIDLFLENEIEIDKLLSKFA